MQFVFLVFVALLSSIEIAGLPLRVENTLLSGYGIPIRGGRRVKRSSFL